MSAAAAAAASFWPSLTDTLVQLALPPFFVLLSLVIFLASFGKSLGVRRLYVRVLLRVFEFAGNLAKEEKRSQKKRTAAFVVDSDEDADSDDEDEGKAGKAEAETAAQRRARLKQYTKESRHNVISRRDNLILSPEKEPIIEEETAQKEWSTRAMAGEKVSAATLNREFELEDVLDYVKTGIASVIEDEVTQRFVAEELKTWNLLTRSQTSSFEHVNMKLTAIWILGFFVRYFVLLPGRIVIFFVGLVWMSICMAFVGQMKDGEAKQRWHYQVYTSCFQILGGAISAVVTYHNPENKPAGAGICVANHTSPIDVLTVACDNAYALIGQQHSGFLGEFQAMLSKCASHIWFERSEAKDRELITKRLREHVEDPTKLPILIFPEGTCINNTSVMQFKKGSFEVGGVIYPVAIKYDPRFGDAFWNSSQDGMLHYIFKMMTSWAIVADVWYLPPMRRKEGEDAVDFANRVKAEIARKGGLVDLVWDGNLKRASVKPAWKEKQQEAFSKRLKVE